MPSLTSPGVVAFVNDLSIYSAPQTSTIPLFIIATRSNKATPDGAGTAPGTIEANKLRVVSSQRELVQNYGNPVFVTSAGVGVPGEETNEYGLFAAHSFLGRGSRAFILRADIDLGGLVPTTQEPVLPPPDGTYWVKSSTVVGGIFRRAGGQWVPTPFSIYTTTPTSANGTDGDWAFDYSNLNGTLLYREGGSWKAPTNANLVADYGVNTNLFVQAVAPTTGIQPDDIWYKTTSSAGGVNLQLARYRAVDGVFVIVPIIRQNTAPAPNQGTVWENLSQIHTNGHRPLYVGTGASFIPLPFVVQPIAPVTEPDNGVYWFDDTFTDFAMYVEGTDQGRGDQWVPVTTTTVSNPSNTQKVISASPPGFPQDGAIWIDISTPEAFDLFPIVKRWQVDQWIDITDSVVITPTDPIASAVLNGTYWINNGEQITRNTVKVYDSAFVAVTVALISGTYQVVPQIGNFWAPAAGDAFGRRAVRSAIVKKLQAAITSNDDIRAESNYYQLIACPGYPELYDEMLALNTDIGEVAFIVGDTPKFTIPTGIPAGREITITEWATNAHNVAATGEDGFSSARTPYAGFYSPWGFASDPDGDNVMVPPSHMVLRTIAYSDSVAAPWFPPAGLTRGRVDNASSVGYLSNNGVYTPLLLTTPMRDVMYENDINPIMNKPNAGLVIYGQKTWAATASALDRINVARLLAKMKYDLARLLEPYVFEINDPVTRRSATVTTERYMTGLKSQRALYDFAVRCDESNNTSDRIDRNELWVDCAIKPAKSIEFIYVPITILNTGDSFPF